MKKLNKVSLGIIALFTLPKIYAYQCQIDLQSNYTDSYLYINNNGDVYAIVNYDDHRYDEIEQVYEARSW